MRMRLILIGLSLAIAVPAFPQAKPAAEFRNSQFLVGGGFTDFSNGMNLGRNMSYAVWADWKPNFAPVVLKDMGIEAEYRSYNFGQVGTNKLDQSTFGGGPIYTYRHFPDIHPYAKFLVNYSQMDFEDIFTRPVSFPHSSWLTWAPGGGVEYRAWGNLWVREDYEYQFWRINVRPGDDHFLNPNGFTIGLSYDLGHRHIER